MTFNSNTVVDPVAKYGGRRCRGWPLLAKHFGVEVRATAVVDRCGVGDEKQPCGFDVVDCAKRRRLGGVRSGAALAVAIPVAPWRSMVKMAVLVGP